jgi:pyrimidine-nucleoside phosphorylase
LETLGCAMIGQTAEIAPLDRRLYALRDVTATVPSIPLIAASIMSKKLAEGLSGLVLDVKVGEGAFIPEQDGALELARTMVGVGTRRGVPTRALLTAMDRPLGRTVGNALEVGEAIDCLRGGGPADLRALVLELAAEMLLASGGEDDPVSATNRAERALDGGGPLERFARMIRAQGGDASVVEDPSKLPTSPETGVMRADRPGIVSAVVPSVLGYGLVELGGGRKRLGDSIDPSVGFVLHVGVGDAVAADESVATVHASTEGGVERGVEILGEAIRISEAGADVPQRPLISHRVLAQSVQELRPA